MSSGKCTHCKGPLGNSAAAHLSKCIQQKNKALKTEWKLKNAHAAEAAEKAAEIAQAEAAASRRKNKKKKGKK